MIRCVGKGTGEASEYDGMFLRRYEPEAHDGQGLAEWTSDVNLAVRFPHVVDARNAWWAIPTTRPVRESDGKPNRPLTAFSVSIERFPEGPADLTDE